MNASKDLFRLEHILESIVKIEELTIILHSFDNFENKWIERDALIRNFEIIGEASNHISKKVKDTYPEVAWNEIKGMRNFISHEYFGLQLDSVWDSAVKDIPILKKQIQMIIADLNLLIRRPHDIFYQLHNYLFKITGSTKLMTEAGLLKVCGTSTYQNILWKAELKLTLSDFL